MKKVILGLISCSFVLLSLAGCGSEQQIVSVNSSPQVQNTKDPLVAHTPSNGNDASEPEVAYGGDSASEFLMEYQFEFYGYPSYFYDIVGREKVEEWASQFESYMNPDGRNKWEMTIVNAILELEIPKDVLLKANPGLMFTNEQYEAVYTKDIKKINEAFVNEYALLHNGKIYTAVTLASYTAQDYEREGITEAVLIPYLRKIRNLSEFSGYYPAIHEASGFNTTYVLSLKGKSHSLDWMISHNLQDYEKEGITEEVLKQYLETINRDELEEEYDYVRSVLIKMQE